MFNCITCAHSIRFSNPQTNYLVCSKCNTVHKKNGFALEKIKISEKPSEDMSPVKLGTSGVLVNKKI